MSVNCPAANQSYFLVDHPDRNCSWKIRVLANSMEEAQAIISEISGNNYGSEDLIDTAARMLMRVKKVLFNQH